MHYIYNSPGLWPIGVKCPKVILRRMGKGVVANIDPSGAQQPSGVEDETEALLLIQLRRNRPTKINRRVDQKSPEHLPQSTKNPSNINQKWTTNHSWRGLGGPLEALGGQDRKDAKKIRTFGASWGHLGAVLRASWGRLGAWIAVLGCLGASWGRLEPS